MKSMSTKEEWLYRLVINNIKLMPRHDGNGYLIDVMLSGIPKDKYDTDMVLKTIGNIQNIAFDILEQYEHDFESLEKVSQASSKLKQMVMEKVFNA